MSKPCRQSKFIIKALSRLISGLERNNGGHQIYRSQTDKYVFTKGTETDLHYHESWEIKIPVIGCLHCRLAERNFDLKETAALLIAPQVIHPTTMPLDARRCGAWLNLLFEKGDARLMLTWGRSEVLYFLSSDQTSELTLLLGRPADDFCDHIAQVIARTGDKTRKMLANKWMAILFGSLIKSISSPQVSSPQHGIVSRTIALMNDMSYEATLTVAHMAETQNISPKYLAFIFRRLTGVSPRQKLIRTRLERAYRQLQNGRFTVKEVAALTGWQNQFYFSNSFRRHYGMTPSQVPVRKDIQPDSPVPSVKPEAWATKGQRSPANSG